jgi:hypothetical protein
VLTEMLDSDSSDGEEEEMDLRYWKKKRRARLLNAQTALKSLFYVRYLKLANDCMEPFSMTTIFYDRSHLGKVFWHRFRLPFSMFAHLCQRYECEADVRKSHDARRNKKHDVCLLALGTFV